MQSGQFQQPVEGTSPAFVYAWLPSGPPRAVLQVIHGMAEHAARYERLAEALTGAGIAVYAQDLPGHGRTAAAGVRGHFADHDGWNVALRAIATVRAEARRRHPGLPLFVLGHSMGSFLLQDDVIAHGAEFAGAVFSAGTDDPGALRRVAVALIGLETLWRGRRAGSVVADALTFRDFNRAFRPNRTAFDWLSRDEAEVDRYVADPLCGFACSGRLWLDLLTASGKLGQRSRLAAVPRSLPLLLLGGSADPATRGEKGARGLKAQYLDVGMREVAQRLYPGARHELFNETCRDEVTRDLVAWLELHLRGAN